MDLRPVRSWLFDRREQTNKGGLRRGLEGIENDLENSHKILVIMLWMGILICTHCKAMVKKVYARRQGNVSKSEQRLDWWIAVFILHTLLGKTCEFSVERHCLTCLKADRCLHFGDRLVKLQLELQRQISDQLWCWTTAQSMD